MGAGRKTQTFTLPEKSVAEKHEAHGHGHGSSTVYSPPIFRNLKKNDLAGVIFGCTNSTLPECQNRKLFGLPSTHFSYVKNIIPGLPLFLFNYTEKMLYGIFEAASEGQFKIEPRAWTGNERELTLYPSQVKIGIKEYCPALPEIQFKPIIKDNYYEEKHFHFELDRAQTQKLIALFRTSRPTTSTTAPQNKTTMKPELKPRAMPPPPPNALGFTNPGRDKIGNHTAGQGTYDARNLAEKVAVSVLDDEVREPKRRNPCPPTWSSVVSNNEKKTPDVNLSVPCGSDNNAASGWVSGPVSNNAVNNTSKASLGESEKIWAGHSSTGHINGAFNSFNPIVGSASYMHKALRTKASSSSSEGSSEYLDSENHPLDVAEERPNILEAPMSFDIRSIVSQLAGEVGNLKLSHLEQQKIISKLERDMVRSRLEIQYLKGKWEGSNGQVIEKTGSLKEEPEPNNDQSLGGSIIVVGGHDGSSYLNTTECYVPSIDLTEPRSPMRVLLKNSSATKLRDEIYLLGGGTNQVWHDEVESYNPFSDKWTSFPSLRRKKGNLASVSFNDKIYVIGGSDGDKCFSEVDMYLLDYGSWTSSKQLLQQRMSHGASEINGAIYVVGGYDRNVYLSSMERFDPRERSWTSLESMPTSRACHSLVVLNEKLFAVGGYDGNKAVSTVDIFDPRKGSWMAGEPMNDCRLYATAVVVGECIYALGGMADNRDLLNTVEYYKEGRGWEATKLKGIGKRLYFSAIAL